MVAFQPIESNSPLHSCSLLHGNSKRYPDLSFPPPSYFTLVARLPFFLFPPPSLLSTPRTRRSPLSYTGFAFYPWNNNASSNPRKRDLLLLGIDASACVRRILDFEAGRASLLVPSLFARLSLSLSLSYVFFDRATSALDRRNDGLSFINGRFCPTSRKRKKSDETSGRRCRYRCRYERYGTRKVTYE